MPEPVSSPRASFEAFDFPRHTLVWVGRGHHGALIDALAEVFLRGVVAQWLAESIPLVVRRHSGSDRAGAADSSMLALGLPLPPALGKRRLAFKVPAAAIVHHAPPLRVSDAAAGLPARWRGPLADLAARSRSLRIEFRVFGSAAWEALTGQPYLTAASDIDFLWRPADAAQVADGIALLRAWEKRHGLRADGEIVFGHDSAVAWREWDRAAREAPDSSRVLVKTRRTLRLCMPSEVAATDRSRDLRAAAAADA